MDSDNHATINLPTNYTFSSVKTECLPTKQVAQILHISEEQQEQPQLLREHSYSLWVNNERKW